MQNARDHQKAAEEEVNAVSMPDALTPQRAITKITYTIVFVRRALKEMEGSVNGVCQRYNTSNKLVAAASSDSPSFISSSSTGLLEPFPSWIHFLIFPLAIMSL